MLTLKHHFRRGLYRICDLGAELDPLAVTLCSSDSIPDVLRDGELARSWYRDESAVIEHLVPGPLE